MQIESNMHQQTDDDVTRRTNVTAVVPDRRRLPLNAAGVLLLAATDVGMPLQGPGISLHVELERLVEAGLSPLEALQTAIPKSDLCKSLHGDELSARDLRRGGGPQNLHP